MDVTLSCQASITNTVEPGSATPCTLGEMTRPDIDISTVWRWLHIHIRKTERVSGRRTVPRHAEDQEGDTEQTKEMRWAGPPATGSVLMSDKQNIVMSEWASRWQSEQRHVMRYGHGDTNCNQSWYKRNDLDVFALRTNNIFLLVNTRSTSVENDFEYIAADKETILIFTPE